MPNLVLLGIRDVDAILALGFIIILVGRDRARGWLSTPTYLLAGFVAVVSWLVLFQFFTPDRGHVVNAVAALIILGFSLPQLFGWQPFRMAPSKALELNEKQLELYRRLFGEGFARRIARLRHQLQRNRLK